MTSRYFDENGEDKKDNTPPETPKRKNKLTKILKYGSISLAFLGYISAYTVDQSEQAVITQFGNPVRVILNPLAIEKNNEKIEEIKKSYKEQGVAIGEGPGLYFKIPFIQNVTKYNRGLIRWNGYPEQVPTRDKRYIWVDATARVYIEDPLKFLRSVGTEERLHARLDDVIDPATRDSISQRDLIEIVRSSNRKMIVTEKELEDTTYVGNIKEGRPKIISEITDKSRESIKSLGLGMPEHDGVMLREIVYVEEVKNAVEQRMSEERRRIAAKYESEGEGEYQRILGTKEREVKRIISEAYKTGKEIEGEADAKATKIYADTYSKDPEFFKFWRSLIMSERSVSEKDTMIFGTDNDLFGVMKGEGKHKK